ncbi:MAG: molybdopterin biosynthesis protein MoeB [Deltaproteobacteria bacterium HGW-Deltaproteobacteria-14]|jgi:molybdopterin/thiamine biosynthesis adenylyltransferase/rhodanese-related sulfurtransferase|nr:MAG: molybdopterin biosynthesis protein MoeB [Deltaproteobacteria bacterium HGW-Deltaproteobacteria-14]
MPPTPTSFSDYLARVRAGIREVTVDELRALRATHGDALLVLDCREPDELEGGVIPGAVPLPRGQLEQRIEGIRPDRAGPIAIYCASGVRSALAVQALAQLGYADAVNVAGGIEAWIAAGHALDHPRRLTRSQLARYSRQLLLPELGEAGQRRLIDARVLIVGAGGLGSPAALYLAAAGVGTLGVIDHDAVDLSNLQRQILHGEDTVGRPKVDSARRALGRLNGDVTVIPMAEHLTADNARRVFTGYDVVVDGTDNFATRYLINDACVLLGIPNVHGAIMRFDGQASVFAYQGGPCYRCLFPAPPPPELAPNCAEAGVLGAICGVVGTIQAVETIKLLAGLGTSLSGRLVSFDALGMRFRELKVKRDPSCAVCGDHPRITELLDYAVSCSAPS